LVYYRNKKKLGRRFNIREKKNESGSATGCVECPEILLQKVAHSRSDAL
jgi:hypothetical protein